MIKFEDNKAIYEQMADRLCDEIIAGTYKADDRIPSVREYAVMLQVNTNTAVKAYELLRLARRKEADHDCTAEDLSHPDTPFPLP